MANSWFVTLAVAYVSRNGECSQSRPSPQDTSKRTPSLSLRSFANIHANSCPRIEVYMCNELRSMIGRCSVDRVPANALQTLLPAQRMLTITSPPAPLIHLLLHTLGKV